MYRLTSDYVAKAMYADTLRIYLHDSTVTEASVHSARGLKWESSPIVYAVHHATLVELCRQQHEALESSRVNTMLLMENEENCYIEDGVPIEDIDAVLALWPDDAEEVEG